MNGLREVEITRPHQGLSEVGGLITQRPAAAWLWALLQPHLTAQLQLQVPTREGLGFHRGQVVPGQQAASDVPLAPLLITSHLDHCHSLSLAPDSIPSSILPPPRDSNKTPKKTHCPFLQSRLVPSGLQDKHQAPSHDTQGKL